MKFKSIEFPDEAEVKVPTDICVVIRGLDEDGSNVYAVLWGSESDTNLPEFMMGLGMCEAAKEDFKERCARLDD